MARRPAAVRTRSFRIAPNLIAEARRVTGAADDTEAVKLALGEVVERARFHAWVRRVAGKGRMRGFDS